MRIDPNKPGLFALLRGEGEPAMRAIAWVGTVVLSGLFLGTAFAAISGTLI